MERMLKRAGMTASVALLTVAGVLGGSLVAYADNLQDTIEDAVTSALVLEAGSSTTRSAGIRVVGNNAQQDPDDGCNIDPGESPLKLDLITPTGITATPDPLLITECGTNFTVVFTAGTDAVSGSVTVAVISGPAGGGTYVNHVSIPITITQPTPTNTKPAVTVQGVTATSYEIGSVPSATCSVTDTQDGPSSFPAVISGTLVHGLGTQTATCDHTDAGGLAADTATITYSVVDTGDPTISHVLTPAAANTNGWYKTAVGVAFTCSDGGSGIQSCGPDTTLSEGAAQSYTGTATDWAGNSTDDIVSGINIDTTAPTINATLTPGTGPNAAGWYKTPIDVDFTCLDGLSGIDTCIGDADLGEGENQSATGTATDLAGNVTERIVSDIDIDLTAPEVAFVGAFGSSYVFGEVPAAPTCSASDDLSGVAASGCAVSGYSSAVGSHELTATATDVAGNTAQVTLEYTVLAWDLTGFFSPVDMGGVLNTVKGGSTVPLKFEVFAGGTELTDIAAIQSFRMATISCAGGVPEDAIEITATGATQLRYDATAGQFIQNWATPKKPGTCMRVTMTTDDGSFISADFKLK
jgi:hypothetical protein